MDVFLLHTLKTPFTGSTLITVIKYTLRFFDFELWAIKIFVKYRHLPTYILGGWRGYLILCK